MYPDEKTQKDLHLIYSTTVEDIRFAKRQQWQITYYALILMAAIYYFMGKYQVFPLSKILISIVGFVTIVLLCRIEKDIHSRYRPRIDAVRNKLSHDFQSIILIEQDYLKSKYKFGYLFIMCMTVLLFSVLLIVIGESV